jgi:ABC-type Zn uptake system ZnuABC Zn-binding protein ZnuA
MRTVISIAMIPPQPMPRSADSRSAGNRRPALRRAIPAAITVPLLAIVLLPGCGGGEDEASGGGGERPRIVASTGIAADITRQVAGDDAEVIQLVPDSANPHSYSLSASEQHDLVESELLVYFDPALEQALPLDAAPDSVAIAELQQVEAHSFEEHERGGGHARDDDGHGREDDDGHGREDDEAAGGGDHDHVHEPGAPDPHVWMDPTRIEAALPALARALGRIDPANANAYRERARAYGEELAALDRDLRRTVATIPAERRKLVTSHDLMGYFADRYGFEFVGAPFGTSPEAEASAGALGALIERVREEGVPAVFAQHGDDPKVLRQLGAEADVEVVDDLLVEGLGAEAGSYAEMMRFTTGRIAEALSGDRSDG